MNAANINDPLFREQVNEYLAKSYNIFFETTFTKKGENYSKPPRVPIYLNVVTVFLIVVG